MFNLPLERRKIANGSKEFSNNSPPKKIFTNILTLTGLAAALVGLYFISTYNYLLFHGVVEIFSVIIAFVIFAIAWNTRHLVDNHFFLFIGIAFLYVATLSFLHMMAYNGMEIFQATFPGANLATQLWLVTRYVFSFSMLISLFFIRRKVKSSAVFLAYTLVTALLLASIFIWQNFPIAYQNGLTPFKIGSEYIMSFVITGAIGLLIQKRKEFDTAIFKYLLAALITAVAAELAFTLYTDVYGVTNAAGHLLNVASFYLVYKALVQTNLTKPFNLLFRNLKKSENELAAHSQNLTAANQQLQQEVKQRENIQRALEESEERLQLKLDSVLSPDIELGEHDLENIIDVQSLQATMEYLYSVTNMTFALLDLKGNILVQTGFQDICSKFHRANPVTCRNCLESDLELSSGVQKGDIHLYKCKNNMWDVVTPLFIGDKHVGNVFFGQFFFEDEVPDRRLFEQQAEKYGFDKEQYLAAFDRIPRYNRKNMQDLMTFYSRLSEMISRISHANLKLAKSLQNQKQLQTKLEEKAAEVEEYASQMEQLADERAKQLKDAERLSAIGATAGMVGHDIRNPLQAIIGDLYLAKVEVEALQTDEESKTNLLGSIRGIEDNILYINKIVADLQDFAKPLNPKQEQVDVSRAVKEALVMVKIPDDIKVALVDAENMAPLTADTTMLKRVFVNLIQNAVQAMPKGGELTIKTSYQRHQIAIEIKDNGEGVPKEVQSKLFTPLMTTKSKGQGFGLAVVKRMTEAMGGKVTFETEIGVGTTFILKFPN